MKIYALLVYQMGAIRLENKSCLTEDVKNLTTEVELTKL